MYIYIYTPCLPCVLLVLRLPAALSQFLIYTYNNITKYTYIYTYIYIHIYIYTYRYRYTYISISTRCLPFVLLVLRLPAALSQLLLPLHICMYMYVCIFI